MKNYFKKFSIMLIMSLILILGCSVSVFAVDSTQNVIYVDANNGNDTNGDGSQATPYKTIDYAKTKITADSLIYIGEGTYTVTSLSGMSLANKTITYIGKNEKTILEFSQCGGSYIGNLNVNNCLLRPANTYGSDTRFLNYSNDIYNVVFNNCLFTKSLNNAYPTGWYHQFTSSAIVYTNKIFNHCTFAPIIYTEYPSNEACKAVSSAYGQYNNCATATKYYNFGGALTPYDTTSFVNAIYDIDFKLTNGDNAVYGVYSGTNAWGNSTMTSSISLDSSSVNLQVGNSKQLTATTIPADAQLTWTSSNPAIATVDSNGNVTAIIEGQATITATINDGSNLSSTCTVTVTNPVLPGITLNKTSDSLTIGQTDNLIATTTPENDTVTWSSSDSSIATVDSNGKVTAVKEGQTIITATTTDGSNISATCTVTVTSDNIPPVSQGTVLNIEPEKNQIHLNEVVSANLIIDNITEIAAEDVRIKYDNTKLKFLGMDEVDGIKLVKSETNPGELRVILASKGLSNVVNAKKALLKLNFQGIASGNALVDVIKGRVSDGIEMEKDLTDSECGQATIIIDDVVIQDVNNSGEFTLLDLAIDARHLGEDPTALTQYNTDQVVNGAVDNNDLLKIGEYMLANPNYQFN